MNIFEIKKFILNHLQHHGKKHLNENSLKFSFKNYSKTNKKQPKNLIMLSISHSSFIFRLNKITKFNNFFLIKKNRITFAIKNCINNKFYNQINNNKLKLNIYLKKKEQNQLLTNKRLLFFYRWSYK